MNTLVLFACVLVLVAAAILGGLSIAFLQLARTGRIPLPPAIRQWVDKIFTHERAPVIEAGTSATGGCLSLSSAGLVLVGFILPWFTCSIPNVISGSYSGLSALIQLLIQFGLAILLSIIGIITGGPAPRDIPALGGSVLILIILMVVVILFVALIPLAGLQIGRLGLRFLQSLESSNEQRRRTARGLAWAGGIGTIPLLCFLSGATVNIDISGLVVARSADIGIWVTLGGFVLAFITAIAVSIAVSLIEQLRNPPA